MPSTLDRSFEFLRLEAPIGGVILIVLNRPTVMNAFNSGMVAELRELFRALEGDSSRVAIITGEGERAFSAGADLEEMLAMSEQASRDSLDAGIALTREIEKSSKIVIAAINGAALGGGMEIALACDLRVARTTAKLGLPEVKVGIFPGWGGTVRLPRLVNGAIAREMILTGKIIDGAQASNIGLLNAHGENALELALSLATDILAAAPIAQEQAKLVISQSANMDIDEAMAFENEAWMRTFFSADRREGHQAFLERRQPTWNGE